MGTAPSEIELANKLEFNGGDSDAAAEAGSAVADEGEPDSEEAAPGVSRVVERVVKVMGVLVDPLVGPVSEVANKLDPAPEVVLASLALLEALALLAAEWPEGVVGVC